MKNRKTIIVAFLLVATLCLGIGYAALTDILEITGTANINNSGALAAFDEDVYISNVTAVDSSEGDSASIPPDNKDKATFTVKSLTLKDDIATFRITVTNDSSEFDAHVKVNPSIVNSNSAMFELTYKWEGEADSVDMVTIAKKTGDTSNIKILVVTIKLLQSPTDTVTGNFGIDLDVAHDQASLSTGG